MVEVELILLLVSSVVLFGMAFLSGWVARGWHDS